MSRKEDVEKQITEHHRHLQVLKERQARQGVETPPSVVIEILYSDGEKNGLWEEF